MSKTFPKARLASSGAALLAAALAVSACSTHTSETTHDPRMLNYDERHAIVLTEEDDVLDLVIASGSRSLTESDRSALRGFVSEYLAQGESTLRILVPSGSANDAAARRMLPEIHQIVGAAGANPSSVLVQPYNVGDPQANGSIRVVFSRVKAVTSQCGDWQDDISGTPMNYDYQNFGCATQSNLAAMVVDPRDTQRPRGLGHADAARRGVVHQKYRAGEPTPATAGEGQDAAVSQVAE